MPSKNSKRPDYVYYLVGFPRDSEIQQQIEEDAHARRYRWAATYLAQLIEDLYTGRLSPDLQPLIMQLLQNSGTSQDIGQGSNTLITQNPLHTEEKQESEEDNEEERSSHFSGTFSAEDIKRSVDSDRNVDAFLGNF